MLNGDGLVGRVKTVGPSTATVLLAVDPESSVGVRLELKCLRLLHIRLRGVSSTATASSLA